MAHMKAIYVHLNPKKFSFSKELNLFDYTHTNIPDYAKYSFEQTEKFLKSKPIILTDQNISEEFTEQINNFYEICKIGFPTLYKNSFWLTTLIRLYIVYLYCKHHNIEKFIHLEYDNLIYSDFANLDLLKPNIYFTKIGEHYSSAGFVYCNNLQSYEKFIIHLQQLIKKGEKIIRQIIPEIFLSEMILINLIGQYTKNVIDYLPTLPFKPTDNNFNLLQTLYDGASYGQYIGGTNNGHAPGWTGHHHYIGQKLMSRDMAAVFDNITKMPYLKYDNKCIPIANLHIHSKKLKQFC